MDKITQNKATDIIQTNEIQVKQLEIRRSYLIKEKYSKQTLSGLAIRLQQEIMELQKERNAMHYDNVKMYKLVEKEKINETAIKEKANQIYSKARKFDTVNL